MTQPSHHKPPPPLHIAYLGPPASFSHQAALALFPSATLTPHSSFSSIFNNLQTPGTDESYDFGILPIENSTNGSVVQVLDLLAQCSSKYPDLEVCAEYYLPVHHFLYTNHDRSDVPTTNNDTHPTLTDAVLKSIKTLYTHPQVWTQCNRFLTQHLSHAERIDMSSTSAAATFVARDHSSSSAAICSQLAGTSNSLHCLAPHIEDEPDKNTTRFFILRHKNHHQNPHSNISSPTIPPLPITNHPHPQPRSQTNMKSLLLFTIPHTQPGSLSSALSVFAKHSLNLTRIDTRPSRMYSWHYVFFVECEELMDLNEGEGEGGDSGNSSKVEEMMEELKTLTEEVSWLGSWVDMLQFDER